MPYTKARQGAEEGMQQAVDHADREIPDWSDDAYDKLKEFSWLGTEFLTEDVRLWAEKTGLESPPDNRAWGAVINRAVKANMIERVGYGPAKTGHMRPMPIWRRRNV